MTMAPRWMDNSVIPEPKQQILDFRPGSGKRAFCLQADLLNPVAQALIQRLLSDVSVDHGLPHPVRARVHKGLGDEAYRLEFSPDEVMVIGGSEKAAYYGLNTAVQILRHTPEGKQPLGFVLDAPSLRVRSFSIGYTEAVRYEYLREMIEIASMFKINTLLLEYTDKFPYRKHPRLCAKHHFSSEQIEGLKQTCRDHYVDLVPMAQSFAHLEFIFKHPEYQHLAEPQKVPGYPSQHQSMVCPCNPGALELITDLYSEIMEAHPDSRYFHIGGDEAILNMGVCPVCQAYVKKHGWFQLYAQHMAPLLDFVRQKGYQPIMWCDELLYLPREGDELECLGRDLVVAHWDYRQNALYVDKKLVPDFSHGTICGLFQPEMTIEELRGSREQAFSYYWKRGNPYFPEKRRAFSYLRYFEDCGFGTMTAPSACFVAYASDSSATVNLNYHVPNIIAASQAAVADGSIGLLNTVWHDEDHSSPNVELAWPGIIAGAEFSWSGWQLSQLQFERKFARWMFNDGEGKVWDALCSFGDTAFISLGTSRNMESLIKDKDLSGLLVQTERVEENARVAEDLLAEKLGDSALSPFARRHLDAWLFGARETHLWCEAYKLLLKRLGGVALSQEEIDGLGDQLAHLKEAFLKHYGRTRHPLLLEAAWEYRRRKMVHEYAGLHESSDSSAAGGRSKP